METASAHTNHAAHFNTVKHSRFMHLVCVKLHVCLSTVHFHDAPHAAVSVCHVGFGVTAIKRRGFSGVEAALWAPCTATYCKLPTVGHVPVNSCWAY